MRDLAVASGAGLSSGSILALLSRVLSDPPPFLGCIPCPERLALCLSSFFLGIGIGVVLIPVLESEFLWLLRAAVLRRIARLFFADSSYYRIL